ncbi:unnamed protein product [Periconia digitata]|uniref:Uncharacterized protein n=1 Tax=Periconia digitata TaxID=1303443 RepID=A0A9W4UHP6_9PLEO|nr:unnamed protein product [Periconia digitata]
MWELPESNLRCRPRWRYLGSVTIIHIPNDFGFYAMQTDVCFQTPKFGLLKTGGGVGQTTQSRATQDTSLLSAAWLGSHTAAAQAGSSNIRTRSNITKGDCSMAKNHQRRKRRLRAQDIE